MTLASARERDDSRGSARNKGERGHEREEPPEEERRAVLRPVSVALLSATHFLARYHRREYACTHKHARVTVAHLENPSPVSTLNSRVKRNAPVARLFANIFPPAPPFSASETSPSVFARSHSDSGRNDKAWNHPFVRSQDPPRCLFVKCDANIYLRRTLRVMDTYLILAGEATGFDTRHAFGKSTSRARMGLPMMDARPRGRIGAAALIGRPRLIVRAYKSAAVSLRLKLTLIHRLNPGLATLRVRISAL